MKHLAATLVVVLAAGPAVSQDLPPLASAERVARRIAQQGPIHRSLENVFSSSATRLAADTLGVVGLDEVRDDLVGRHRALSAQTTNRPPYGSTNYFKALLLVGILFVATLFLVLSAGID